MTWENSAESWSQLSVIQPGYNFSIAALIVFSGRLEYVALGAMARNFLEGPDMRQRPTRRLHNGLTWRYLLLGLYNCACFI